MEKVEKQNEQKPYRARQMKFRWIGLLLAGVIIVCATGYLSCTLITNRHIDPDIDADTRAKWAKPMDLPGLPNLHKVSEDLYRGAQPSAEGMRQLEKLGVKTVVNLRSSHSDRDELKGTSLAYEHIEMTAWNPEFEDVVRFLQIVSDSNSLPVFVHCQHGADRTGLMCAVYRIAVQGWSKDEAIMEMTEGGFGFHEIWKNLPNYIRRLDIDQAKHKANVNK
ncbi:dual specificity protein phosphatase family protein [Planctomycetota bacterium]